MHNPTMGFGEASAVDTTASQRALELRKFFEPFYDSTSPGLGRGLKATITSDGALDAFAETVLWRLRGVRTMVSLIDRTTQYFLAGASRQDKQNADDLSLDRTWFGCSIIPTPGGLCEHTLALDCAAEKHPCFVVNDLREDDRFAYLPVVDGSVMAYRFYAGTPITTDRGINIGSLFMFDDRPRPGGLTIEQRKSLFEAASNVMRHLETKREAAERRRVAHMSKGIANFLETTSHVTEADLEVSDASELSRQNSSARKASSVDPPRSPAMSQDVPISDAEHEKRDEETGKSSSLKVLGQIKLTLDHAADILRESLELTVGGVVFLDTALGYRDADTTNDYFNMSPDAGAEPEALISAESKRLFDSAHDVPAPTSAGAAVRGGSSPGQVRAFNDQYQPAKILAMSVSETARWSTSIRAPDEKTLQGLIGTYPKGNIWYIDDDGYFSSIDQVDDVYGGQAMSPSGKRRSRPQFDMTRQRDEANLLSRIFVNARQIVFLPLWDAGGNRWYSGCFVWSQSAVPVFTVDPETAYLSAFTNSMMVEISRLEAITANKMKSDFISSISHEFRSPLHGILASTEFLRDSKLDSMQTEFISTIQNCGSTLLDTINHVLDYSKINSFEKKGRETGSLSNELYQCTDVVLLCEEVVYGMMAAKEFRGITESNFDYKPGNHKHLHHSQVHIILDFEHRDWKYRIQSGALRRVIMNIFGNANKYTETGFIQVQLRVREVEKAEAARTGTSCQHVLIMRITDSGCGMSTEYMERKLYTPFAQEDSFSPGIGLGLSIVWSIVSQLGGTIHIRSDVGKGTDVEVNLPLERGDSGTNSSSMARIEAHGASEAHQCLDAVRKVASGKSVAIIHEIPHSIDGQSSIGPKWQCIKKYCSIWFGFNIVDPEDRHMLANTDLIIVEKDGEHLSSHLAPEMNISRVLLIRDGMTCVQERRSSSETCSFESIWSPIGPYKLARAVYALFKDQLETEITVQDTPLAVPSEISTQAVTSLSSSGISTPTSSMQQSVSDYFQGSTVGKDQVPEVLAIRSASGLIGKLEPLQTPTTTATTVISDMDLGAAQALQNLQSLVMPQSIPPESPNETFTPGMLSPQIVNGTFLRILAVDDNILNLQLLHRYLIKRPQDIIVTARNGVEAVTAVRQARIPFDIILMDLSMPDMDGFEATRLIRVFEKSLKHREASEIEDHAMRAAYARTRAEVAPGEDHIREEVPESSPRVEARHENIEHPRHTPAYIVALTGLASRRDRDEAEESGFDDFLTKPISFVKIGALLARMSAGKESRSDV